MSKDLIQDPSKLRLRGLKNGEVLQDCGIEFVPPLNPTLPFALQLTVFPK